MEIELEVSVDSVLEEVAQKSGYAGAKMLEPEGVTDTYDRVQTVDEDEDELTEFWDECVSDLVMEFGDTVVSEGYDDNNTDKYLFKVKVADTFNTATKRALDLTLYQYFVYGILSRWYMYTNKEEAAAYADMAGAMMGKLRSRTMTRFFTRKQRPF